MEIVKQWVVTMLVWEARLMLRRQHPQIVAITGSVGKTTTKEAVFAAIKRDVYARRSRKSYNGELGVALTILGLENGWNDPLRWLANIVFGLVRAIRQKQYPAWLVVEVGADRPGDIRRIAAWLQPDIAIITGVSQIPAHVEYFDSPEHVYREKRSLAEYVKPGGTVILNGDDPRMREIRNDFRGISVLYGYADDNDFVASHDQPLYEEEKPVGVQFRANYHGSSVSVVVRGALGAPRVYAALAALAVAKTIGIDGVRAAEGLTEWSPPPGRVRLLDGIKGSVIIDDSYNSSPAAALAALETLRETAAKRRIAVMGDMLELGKYTKDAHRLVGERAASSCEKLITIGIRSRTVAQAALDAKLHDEQILQYDSFDIERAADELARDLQNGDLVLVKGSQSMRLERFVRGIMAEPHRAAELLVRMDPEWQSR